MCDSVTDLFDVLPLCSRPSQSHADGVEQQTRQSEQLHARAHQTCCYHIVHKERSLVGQEHTPGGEGSRRGRGGEETVRRGRQTQTARRKEKKKRTI